MSNDNNNDETAKMVVAVPTVKQLSDGKKCRKVSEYSSHCASEVEQLCNVCAMPENSCACPAYNTSVRKAPSKRRPIQNSCCGTCWQETCVCDKYGMPLPKAPTHNMVSDNSLFVTVVRDFIYPEPGFWAPVELMGASVADCQPLASKKYGELHVRYTTDKDGNEQVNLENKDVSGEFADLVGRPVPCGTEFYPASSSISSTLSTSNCNELTADFHIPPVSSTSPAVVTSFQNFAIGEQAVIRNKLNPSIAYIYKVLSFSGTNKIILQNENQGGPIGDTLFADPDCDGTYAWCVESFDQQSIADQAIETQCVRYLLGIDENDNPVKIRGGVNNDTPVYDTDCGGYTNQVIENASGCRNLTSCFQLPTYGDDPCDRPTIYIETSEDEFILSGLAEALLTETGYPVVKICDYEFIVDLADSSPGAIAIIPTFPNPDAVIKFDESCKVCIPEDCCTQCSPQIGYPIAELSPNAPGGFGSGLNLGAGMTIPIAAMPAAGDYRFTIVRSLDESTFHLFAHDPVTGSVTAAYDPTGAPIDLNTLDGDVNTDYYYYNASYCNGEKCPVSAEIKDGVTSAIRQMQDGFCLNLNHYGLIELSSCLFDAVPRATQYNNSMFFDTPLKIANIANQNFGEAWIAASGPGLLQPLNTQGQDKSRIFQLNVGECVELKITPFVYVRADAAATTPIIIAHASTTTFSTEVY